ncbi:uncharacterized protein LOC126887192 [Diabrotica virgifera virgifera]|uniref:Uncharacterized protein LOC114342204 n=1 Tax=Diabrotica virgifera virgifera TaxID=50390 RepID=A0A6P7GYE1_DIAVI|nr:uncharacterized protein LOC126887192 [Diabrotica virgifera virgifera]
MTGNGSFLADLINYTTLEDNNDNFGDDSDSYEDVYTFYGPFSKVVNIFKDIILSLFILVLDCILLYLFCSFSKIRKKYNVYILNFVILDTFAQIKSIIDFLFIYTLSVNQYYKFSYVIFLTVHFYKYSLAFYFILSFLLALEWFVESYRPHLLNIPDFVRNVVLFVLNCIVLVLGIFTYFLPSIVRHDDIVIFIAYFATLFSMLILNVLVRRVDLTRAYVHTSYILNVANIVFVSYFILILYNIFLIYVVELNFVCYCILLFTLFIPQLLAHAHFVLIMWVFYKNNIDVRNVVNRHFKVLEDFNDDRTLTENQEVEENTYIHADNFGSVDDTRRISSFI